MTLADYSLSIVTFETVENWKNILNQLISSSNQTEALEAMIPQMEEFIYVARSELVCCQISRRKRLHQIRIASSILKTLTSCHTKL